MKGHEAEYPYNPLEGLNPFKEELKEGAKTLAFSVNRLGVVAQLAAYFTPFPEVTSDDIGDISVYSSSVVFNLAVKDSKFVHKLAQFTGLNFEKTRSWTGLDLTLQAKVTEDHYLAKIGIPDISVAGYLPQTCKTVVKEYKPLDENQREVYQKLIDKGQPVYE